MEEIIVCVITVVWNLCEYIPRGKVLYNLFDKMEKGIYKIVKVDISIVIGISQE